MADESSKSQVDQLADVIAQLKEMHHYAKNNVERLTAIWMLFDDDLKKLKQTGKIEDLMNRQGQLHDALEAAITDLEKSAQQLRPPESPGA